MDVASRYRTLFPKMNIKIDPTETWVALYDQLEAYYLSNGLYNSLNSAAYYLQEWHENMKPLYNPANRSVEFFATRIMPGNLPDAVQIVTDNPRIIGPIHKIWKWSNLNSKKTASARWLTNLGDLFIHPTSNDSMTQVYLQFLKPQYITDWVEDDRGNIKFIRIDKFIGNNKWHTETWDEFEHNTWVHVRGKDMPVSQLGMPMSIPISDYGIDFVPFVHIKFIDIGDKRGQGAFTHCLDKIDETNRMATRLHEILFRYNKPYLAVSANMQDSQGKPLPAPSVASGNKSTSRYTSSNTVEVSDETIFYMPGMSSIENMIPDLKYADALAILNNQIIEIEKDLPELSFYKLREKGNLSGVAVSLMLGDALSRATEARSNWEAGMNRAENMALSMGSAMGLWSNIGTYDNDDFEHTYNERDIFEEPKIEETPTIENTQQPQQVV